MRPGDGLREAVCAGVGPADVQTLGQNDQATALRGRGANRGFRAIQIGRGLAAGDENLGHADAELTVCARGGLVVVWFDSSRAALGKLAGRGGRHCTLRSACTAR